MIIALFFIGFTTTAQEFLKEGEFQLNAGLGLSTRGIPIYVGADYGLMKNITLGGELSFRSKNEATATYSALGISVNGNYHFDFLPEADIYGGANIGYYSWSASNGTPSNNYSAFSVGLQAGIRYFFDDTWGVNFELGGGNISGAKIGVTYKF